MRHVDTRGLAQMLPDGWEERAAAARTTIETADPETRRSVIEEHAEVWRVLKKALSRLSHGKCWYCEAHERRSTNAVDHFRPKSAILEAPDHSGYWWLAAKPSNFRFACEFCNSYGTKRTRSVAGGKRTHFPLVDEQKRARDGAAVDHEFPKLLDPVSPTDPGLLWFDPDGNAVANPRGIERGLGRERAELSAKIYNLNEVRLTDARLALNNRVVDLVRTADMFFRRADAGDQTAQLGFERTVAQIYELAQPESEFSSAVRSALMRMRSSSAVPEMVLLNL